MSTLAAPPLPRRRRFPGRFVMAALAVVVGVGAVAWGVNRVRETMLAHAMLALMPDDVLKHKDMVAYADAEGRKLFAKTCAACHGADMKGNPAVGAPNLTDNVWLYGDDGVYGVERTIMYGIRSTQKKGHDVTEMPAFGQRGQLTPADINNVVQYLYQISGRPNDGQSAELGKAVYINGRTTCYDCHGTDAKGNGDYGAPDLTANVWNYGGDPRSLYNSIYYGRHGEMPAWIGKLSLEQIRALSVYVYTSAHR
jgi:cytochrome c oxidase cbb3-type subunit 3